MPSTPYLPHSHFHTSLMSVYLRQTIVLCYNAHGHQIVGLWCVTGNPSTYPRSRSSFILSTGALLSMSIAIARGYVCLVTFTSCSTVKVKVSAALLLLIICQVNGSTVLFTVAHWSLIMYFCMTVDNLLPWLYPSSHFLQVYYVSSGLGLYFVYDFCLYSNMSPIVSYFLRYLPLIIATIVCTTFALLRWVVQMT